MTHAPGTLADAELRAQLERLPGIAYRCRVTPEWPMRWISPGCEAITGWPPEDFLSGAVHFGSLIEASHQQRVWATVQSALDEGRPFRVTYTIRDRSGGRRWLWEQGRAVDGPEGVELEGLICDVTPQEEARDALEESRRFSERVAATVPGHVLLFDLRTGGISFSNRAIRDWIGADLNDQGWQRRAFFLDRLHPEDLGAAETWLRRWDNIDDGEVVEWRYRLRSDSGAWRWRWMRSTAFERDAEGKVLQVLCVAVDTTEHDEAVRSRAESEQRHRLIMKGATDGIFVCDAASRFLDVNPAGCEQLRRTRDQLLDLRLSDLMAADVANAAAAEQAGSTPEPPSGPFRPELFDATGSLRIERQLLRGDGSWGLFELHGRLLDDGTYVVLTRDRTEHKAAEQERLELMREVMEAQRLESLGLLSGGIAHDFNNLLATISGSVEVCLQRWPSQAEGQERLSRILLATRRASELTRQLLDYVGSGSHEVVDVDLGAMLEEMPLLLEASLGPDVTLRYDLEEGLPAVQGDPGRLRQLVMNLVVNASEAIGARRGSIRLSTSSVQLTQSGVRTPTGVDLEPGRYVTFVVSDDGCGVQPEDVERIFEPFFSTKGTGRGLGLAAVRGIVDTHGGAMRMRTVPGQGTRVQVWLPAVARRRKRYHSGVWNTEWKGEGLVLLVDDEPDVRAVLGELVEALGFSVVTVDGGFAALEQLEARTKDVAVVLLDVTMPVLDGVATWQRIVARWPTLPVVLMSGMAAPEVGELEEGALAPGFLMKPFSLEQLQQALQHATGLVS